MKRLTWLLPAAVLFLGGTYPGKTPDKRIAQRLCAVLCVLVLAGPAFADAPKKRPMVIDDLFRFKRVADPQISPDAKNLVYTVTEVDLDHNRTSSTLWLASTAKEAGGPRQLTTTSKSDRHPRWSPDGKHVLFESNRSGEMQLWVIAVGGGEARQLTSIATEAGTGIWSSDGKQIAFVSAVWPEYSEKPYKESNNLNRKRKEDAAKGKKADAAPKAEAEEKKEEAKQTA